MGQPRLSAELSLKCFLFVRCVYFVLECLKAYTCCNGGIAVPFRLLFEPLPANADTISEKRSVFVITLREEI